MRVDIEGGDRRGAERREGELCEVSIDETVGTDSAGVA